MIVRSLVALAMLCSASAAVALDGSRLRVIDGDTVALGSERIRLAAIDAPELQHPRCPAEQRLALTARDRLAALVKGRDVQIRRQGRDRYGRTLATLSVGGRDIGTVLVSEGLAIAWVPGRAGYEARFDHWCGRGR